MGTLEEVVDSLLLRRFASFCKPPPQKIRRGLCNTRVIIN
jgi:hypothetical protein